MAATSVERPVAPAASTAHTPANRLLSALSPEDRRRLLPLLERVSLAKGAQLYDTGDPVSAVYFPLNGLGSLLSLTQAGQTVELAMVGQDGMLGIDAILQNPTARCQIVVQLPMDALRITADRLRGEFDRHPAVRLVLLRYTSRLLEQTAQSVVCHRFHTVAERLARWLLAAQDRLGTTMIPLTQETIAALLGSPRTAVTTAAAGLQDRGVIRQRHGRTYILHRAALAETACECYAAGCIADPAVQPRP